MHKILVVDDDKNLLKLVQMRLAAEGYAVTTAESPEEALASGRRELFDLALLDLKLEGKDGIELMEELTSINPNLAIIILTAYGTIKGAVEAIKKGACTYMTKPFQFDELLLQMENCLEKSRLSMEVKRLKNLVQERYGFENIVGKSGKMLRVLDQVSQAAKSDAVVFIKGESGTGKELIAKSLHVASARKDGPFVAINCAAIPETLLESELFGYETGAFTGADRSKQGLFARAHKGTLFLDEISEMSLTMQAKILRVLENMEFYPLGSGKTVRVDARVITASNRDLEEEVKNGRFRNDLFYRIHVIAIELPPLRERKEDIPLLARYFLRRFAEKMNKAITGFSPSALQKLLAHDWPGNVRELENSIESAVAMAVRNVITDELVLPAKNPAQGSLKPFKDAKQEFEKEYLLQLIELTAGNVSQAAKLAGKHRADLYELLKKYDLNPTIFRKKESSNNG